MEIYFHVKIIYFHDMKIYFHDVKKVFDFFFLLFL